MPPEEAPARDQTLTGFWPELVKRVRSALKPPAQAMFVVNDHAPVSGVLQGDELVLQANADFALRLINRPNVLQVVSDAASALTGRPVRVQARLTGALETKSAGFDRLLRFGQEHPEIVDVRNL